MKLFVGWPYDQDWIERQAIPLIESYGFEIFTGKELAGREITEGVRKKIEEADAGIFFTTRRGEPRNDGSYYTSDWVTDEIKHARSLKKHRVLEIREEGVEYSNKINEALQYIPLKSSERLPCLVELGKTIGKWMSLNLKMKLRPQEFAEFSREIRLNNAYTCTYRFLLSGENVESKEVRISDEEHGLFLYIRNLPISLFCSPDSQVTVQVEIGKKRWSSFAMGIGLRECILEKESGDDSLSPGRWEGP